MSEQSLKMRRAAAVTAVAVIAAGLVGVASAPALADPPPIVPDGVYLAGGGWVAPSTEGSPSQVWVHTVGSDYCESEAGADRAEFTPEAEGSPIDLEINGLGWSDFDAAVGFLLPVGLTGKGTLAVGCSEGGPTLASFALNINAEPPSTYHTPGQFTIYHREDDQIIVDKVGYLPGETVTVTAYDPLQYEVNYDHLEAHPVTEIATADGEGAIHLEFPASVEWDGSDVAAIVSSGTSRLLYDTAWADGELGPDPMFASSTSAPPGGSIAVSGSGYEPGESVVVALHSTSAPAVVLGVLTADGGGAFSGTVPLPGDTALGTYRVFAGAKTIGYLLQSVPIEVEEQIFADVTNLNNSFYSYIQWIGSSGISTGTPNPPGKPLYKPVDAVSRMAMAAFLYRYSGATFTSPAEQTFADVDASNPFYTPIEWMAAEGISTGTPQPEGKPLYKPLDPVSRQAMAIFLARYAGIDVSTPPTEQSFADVPIDAAPAAAIAWMKQGNISTGTAQPSGLPLYKPSDPVSRQAMAAFLMRVDIYQVACAMFGWC